MCFQLSIYTSRWKWVELVIYSIIQLTFSETRLVDNYLDKHTLSLNHIVYIVEVVSRLGGS